MRKKQSPPNPQVSAASLARKQDRIDQLEGWLTQARDAAEKKERSLVDQLRQQSRLIDKMKLDHAYEIARLGARISALEFTTVLAHGHAGMLTSKLREVEQAGPKDLAAVVGGDQAALAASAATPVSYTPMKFRRNGDRWDLLVS